jgi:hypothetical protein
VLPASADFFICHLYNFVLLFETVREKGGVMGIALESHMREIVPDQHPPLFLRFLGYLQKSGQQCEVKLLHIAFAVADDRQLEEATGKAVTYFVNTGQADLSDFDLLFGDCLGKLKKIRSFELEELSRWQKQKMQN